MLNELSQPIIFAHRGASAHAPENTIASFELAIQQGADGLELDVKLSADGQVVVIHDQTVDRTTGESGRVKDLSAKDLRALDVGSFFSKEYSGEKVPLLAEVLETLGKRTYINIELTNYATRRDHLVESVCMLVKKFGLQKRVMFSSFLASNLKSARNYIPEIPLGLLAYPSILGSWHRSFEFAFGNYEALHPYVKDVNRHQVNRVHRLGKRIHVWTVNAESDLRRLFQWGVDAVFTDDPQLAVKVRGENK